MQQLITGLKYYARPYLGGGRIAKAVLWTSGAHIAAQALRIAAQLVLARLLAPEAFGITAIVLVIVVILHMLSDLGLGAAVVRSPNGDDPVLLDTIWTVQVIRGVTVWAACLAISALLALAQSYGAVSLQSTLAAPQLPLILAVSTFSSVISGFQSTKILSANRAMSVHKIFVVELMAQAIGLIAIIALAVATRSVWALVLGSLITSLVMTGLSHFWLPGRNNTFAWNADALAEVRSFGKWIALSSSTVVVAANADKLLLAGLVPPALMGLYSLSLNLIMLVDTFGSRLTGYVALPALSESFREDPAGFKRAIYRMRLPYDAFYLASSGMLFAIAPDLVNMLYDKRYQQAGAILRILSLSLIFMRYNLFGTVYMALGQPRWVAALNAAKLGIVLALIPLAYVLFGVTGIIYAAALQGAFVLPLIYWMNQIAGINDLRFELQLSSIWLVGAGVGWMLTFVLHAVV